jgi:hypothetical protein
MLTYAFVVNPKCIAPDKGIVRARRQEGLSSTFTHLTDTSGGVVSLLFGSPMIG